MYTYDDMRFVLKRLGFVKIRSRKHETWEKIVDDRIVLQVRLRLFTYKKKPSLLNGKRNSYKEARKAGGKQ